MEMDTIAIGQGGGPTPVHNAQVAGALYEAQLARKQGRIRKIVAPINGLEGILRAKRPGHVIDITHWNPEIVRRRPGSVLYTTRLELEEGKTDDEIALIKDHLQRLGIQSIAYFGGEDSAKILKAIGIGVHGAKTVDNNLLMAHHTSGWGSATLFNAVTVKHLSMDIGSYRVREIDLAGEESYLTATVTVYKTQGRGTGWLTEGAGLAKVDQHGQINPKLPPDIIWTPQIPFDADVYLSALSDVLQRKGKAFVVISEELVNKEGIPLHEIYGRDSHDPHGHAEHGRSGAFDYADFVAGLSKSLKVRLVKKIKETPITPAHIPRCYVQSATDEQEAFEIGRETVRSILDGDSQVSVVLQKINGEIKPVRVPLEAIAGKNRPVPSEFFDGMRGPTQKFADEFLYLIGGAKAIPHYEKLDYSRAVLLSPKTI